jgi:hypothetical protein
MLFALLYLVLARLVEDEPAEGRVDSVRARGRTPTESSSARTPLELVVQVPWSRRP